MDDTATKRAELRRAIIEAAFAADFHPTEIAPYILALEELGALEHDKPMWMVKSLLFRIENGWRPSSARLRAINDHIGRLVDGWLADPAISPIPDNDFLDELFQLRADAETQWTPRTSTSPYNSEMPSPSS